MTALANSRVRPLRYTATAKVLHWAIVVAVVALLASGPIMKRLLPEGPLRDRIYDWHEALGAVVLIVMVVRLARRLLFGAPAPEATLSALDRVASLLAQYALYILLFIVPVLGWAGTNTYGDPVSVFGLFPFPTLWAKDPPLSDQIFVWHLYGGIVIGGIAAVHAAGALYHGFVQRDGVLARMLPGG
jgi:cytochrome b561